MKTTLKFLATAVAAAQLLIAVPVFAAPPAKIIRLEPIMIVAKRATPSVEAQAAAPVATRLEPIVIIGHRDAPSDAQLVHATSAPGTPKHAAI